MTDVTPPQPPSDGEREAKRREDLQRWQHRELVGQVITNTVRNYLMLIVDVICLMSAIGLLLVIVISSMAGGRLVMAYLLPVVSILGGFPALRRAEMGINSILRRGQAQAEKAVDPPKPQEETP